MRRGVRRSVEERRFGFMVAVSGCVCARMIAESESYPSKAPSSYQFFVLVGSFTPTPFVLSSDLRCVGV